MLMKSIFKQAYFMTRDSDDYVKLHVNEPHLEVTTTETFWEDDGNTVIERIWFSKGKIIVLGFDRENKFPVSQERPIRVEMKLWTSEL